LLLPHWVTMSEAIQLDVQKCFDAEEIENVLSELVLPSKFINRKPAVSQPPPH